jgi:hypothetical protein
VPRRSQLCEKAAAVFHWIIATGGFCQDLFLVVLPQFDLHPHLYRDFVAIHISSTFLWYG